MPDPTATANGGTQPTPAKDPKATEAPQTTSAPAVDPLTVDISAAIEKARQQEKQKLYADIQRHEAEATAAKTQAAQLTAALEAVNKKLAEVAPPAKTDQATKPEASGVKQEDLEKIVNTSIAAALKRAEEVVFGPKIAALEAQVTASQKELEKRDLASYRNDLIGANKEVIVPELVTGSTREELDTSLVRAKQAFAQIAQAVAAKVGANPGGLPLPPVAGGGGKVTNGTDVLSSVGSMSVEEYAAKRADLLKAANEAARAAMNQG